MQRADMRPFEPRTGIIWQRLALWALIVAVAGLGLAFPAAAQPAGPEKAGKLDRFLEQHATNGPDDEAFDVIITVRPGARRGLLKKLAAHGASVRADFQIIEAVAAELPARLIRILEDDKDVVTISYNSPVAASGIYSSVSGSAANNPYTLRATLGLEQTSFGTATIAGSFATTTRATGVKKSSITWTHTVADGANRILVVATAHRDNTKYVKTVTYGGLPLSIRMSAGGGSATSSAAIWYMVAPPVGTASVVVTMSTSADVAASATTFTGVDQTTPFTPGAASASISTTASVSLTSAVGQVVLAAVAANGDAKTLVESWSNNLLWTDGSGTGSSNVRGASATRSGGGTVTVGWTLGASKAWGIVATCLRPASVPVATPATTLTGEGVTVAVIDSGLLQDGGGTDRIRTTRDFTGGSATPSAISPLDPYGHGTHVAGLVGGDKAEVRGVAPGAKYVSLRVLDGQGQGQTSNVISALQWAVANRATYGIDVLNLSLGHPIYEAAATDPLVQAVEAAVRAGIVVVVAAGNVGVNPETGQVGYAGITSPGNAPSAITVGAVKAQDTTARTDDVVADYSSRGPTWYDAYAKPDLVAPGHRLVGPATTAQYLYTTYPELRYTPDGALQVPETLRHEHGGRGGERVGGADDRGDADRLRGDAVAQRREGAADADGAPDERRRRDSLRRADAGRGRAEHGGRGDAGGGDRRAHADGQRLARDRRHRIDHHRRAEHRLGLEHRVGRRASSGAVRFTRTSRRGRPTWCGARASCGAPTWCGARMWCGARASCGAPTWCGARPATRRASCGARTWCGARASSGAPTTTSSV